MAQLAKMCMSNGTKSGLVQKGNTMMNLMDVSIRRMNQLLYLKEVCQMVKKQRYRHVYCIQA